MIIDYHRPGDMTITLEEIDVQAFDLQDFTMARDGLIGSSTKTWVRMAVLGDTVSAQIDGSHDIYVDLPNGLEDLPARVEAADIDSYITHDRGQIDHFFGESGAIIVNLAVD